MGRLVFRESGMMDLDHKETHCICGINTALVLFNHSGIDNIWSWLMLALRRHLYTIDLMMNKDYGL